MREKGVSLWVGGVRHQNSEREVLKINTRNIALHSREMS